MGTLLTFLPYTGLAAFAWALVATWRWAAARRDRDAWKGACLLAKDGEAQALGLLADMQRMVNEWKARAASATAKAMEAQQEASVAKARFDALADDIRAEQVPPDAEGALAWMARVADRLRQEVGR